MTLFRHSRVCQVSMSPSSLLETSAVLRTAGRRRHLQQPYSSVPPLKSEPPETGKKKAEVRHNDNNDRSMMANLSSTEAMKFKKSRSNETCQAVFFFFFFFWVLCELFISQHALLCEGSGAEKPFYTRGISCHHQHSAFVPLLCD